MAASTAAQRFRKAAACSGFPESYLVKIRCVRKSGPMGCMACMNIERNSKPK
jgi:hypothetical protein